MIVADFYSGFGPILVHQLVLCVLGFADCYQPIL